MWIIETNHQPVLLSSEDGDLSGKRFYLYKRRNYWEIRVRHEGRVCGLGRVVMARVVGRPLLRTEFVDHIDRNTFNNQRTNLRVCSIAENNRNVAKRAVASTSVFKGVRFYKGGWVANIWANNKRYYLGRYATEREAAAAYNGAAVVLHKEFAVLNMQEQLREPHS